MHAAGLASHFTGFKNTTLIIGERTETLNAWYCLGFRKYYIYIYLYLFIFFFFQTFYILESTMKVSAIHFTAV